MYIKTLELIFLISYQDYVAEMLEGDCVVHHSPWAGDGGSLDTRYILQCLPMLLSSSVFEPVHYDAIIFNAGLHDVDCCNFSKEVNKPWEWHYSYSPVFGGGGGGGGGCGSRRLY